MCALPHFRALGNGKVLLEGQERRRELLCWLIRQWGLEVDSASSIDEAQGRMRQAKRDGAYEAVIVQADFQGASDREIVSRLCDRESSPGCALLLIGCAVATSSETLARDERVFRHLGRPVLCRSLYESLSAAMNLGKMRGRPQIGTRSAGRRKRGILLVEDNTVNQKLAVHLLRKMGHCVVLAMNGAKACEAVKQDQFDLVLMDLQMPVIGGLEATQIIRQYEAELGRRTPIVAMTAHAAERDKRRCLEAGMDGYLVIEQAPVAARVGRSVQVTISIGLALSMDFATGNAEEIIQRADEALYAAKRGGRNRVCVAQRERREPEVAETMRTEGTLSTK